MFKGQRNHTFTAWTLNSIFIYDGLEFGFDSYSHECSWLYDGQEFLTRMWIWSLQNECSWNSQLWCTKILTSIRVWPLQQWMLMKLSDKLFHYDMLWFSKRRPTRCRHDDLNFLNFQCPRKIVCRSLNRNLWYHLILLNLEKWCFLIPSEMEPMPNSRAC